MLFSDLKPGDRFIEAGRPKSAGPAPVLLKLSISWIPASTRYTPGDQELAEVSAACMVANPLKYCRPCQAARIDTGSLLPISDSTEVVKL